MKSRTVRLCALLTLAVLLAVAPACNKARDDSQITSQIQTKLSNDSGLQGKQITVQTAGGVVTLSGAVDNEAQRTAAARYASTIPGIKAVVNNLTTAETAARPADQPAQHQSVQSRAASGEPVKAKSRPTKPRRRTEQNAGEMSANTPAPTGDEGNYTDNAANAPAAYAAPAPAPPPPPAPRKITVPSGASIAIRLVDPIDSEKAQVGQTFRATLNSPVPSDGDVALPSGYDVKGHIEDVKSAGKFAGQSLLLLQLDSISVSGRTYGIDADPYRREGSNRTTNTAKKVGAGAAIGAIIGGIAGGGKGAGIGAAAGGGIGGGVQAAGKGQQIQLPSETVLTFNLKSPLTVTLADNGPDSARRKLDTPQE